MILIMILNMWTPETYLAELKKFEMAFFLLFLNYQDLNFNFVHYIRRLTGLQDCFKCVNGCESVLVVLSPFLHLVHVRCRAHVQLSHPPTRL